MNAYEMDDHPTIFAAHTAEEAAGLYWAETGTNPEDGYPRQLTDAELDQQIPELDENEADTGRLTSVRAMLTGQHFPGFLASAA